VVTLANAQVISISSHFFGSRIGIVTENAAILLGNAAEASCAKGVRSLKNLVFQFVNGNARVVPSETGATQIETTEITVIATAIAECK